MPKWMQSMVDIDGNNVPLSHEELPAASIADLRRLVKMYKARALALDEREKDLQRRLQSEKENSKELGKQLRSSTLTHDKFVRDKASEVEKLLADLDATKSKNDKLERELRKVQDELRRVHENKHSR